tara:strand:- start:1372 stop:1794 length:423 start_codon:yes stop_codon:yes gene_type:complete
MIVENILMEFQVSGAGMYEITTEVNDKIRPLQIQSGMLNLFIRHTSASLMIQENADPSAKKDLEVWLERLVPENDLLYTHIAEGADDMPAHIKAMLTAVSLSIPISEGSPMLGTWQGIFLWEHRSAPHKRQIVLNASGKR